jgi:uncharacterized integral membrane protein
MRKSKSTQETPVGVGTGSLSPGLSGSDSSSFNGPPSAHPAGAPAATPTNDSRLTDSSPVRATTPQTAGTAVGRSRAGTVWVAAISVAIVVIALIVFIAQNSQKVTIHFVGFHGHASLALALLVAAVGGILLVAIPGSTRILQLRHTVKKQLRR